MPRAPSNLIGLRERLGEILGEQKSHYTGTQIPGVLASIGLNDYFGVPLKRDHFRGAVYEVSDEQLVFAAGAALAQLDLPVVHRDELQELYWDDGSRPAIPARYRRDVSRRLDQQELFLHGEGFLTTLASFWRIDERSLLADFSLAPQPA
ncbi:hypothetical protein [Pseudomonas protegens]|uniref:hypothetical protein n=1 Tax=Pseudomonas protegens TaxID=380021 RepID=UPI00227DE489|nr:hypothetical protein [Pseudomonas protegens]